MNKYNELQEIIYTESKSGNSFETMSHNIESFINHLDKNDFISVVQDIGVIPENTEHDSSEEKLYAKVSDIVLSRGLKELGYKTRVLTERADAADVYAESRFHNYSLVGDSKVFRLSRTAKNQKDFKVAGVNHWKENEDSDFGILCSPFFEYPSRRSQIYRESIEDNVSLFSWEYLIFMLKNNVKEDLNFSLKGFWEYSSTLSDTPLSKLKNCFLHNQSKFLYNYVKKQIKNIIGLPSIFNDQIKILDSRADIEKKYWQNKIDEIRNYSYERAINELISTKKIPSKIKQIDKFISQIKQRSI